MTTIPEPIRLFIDAVNAHDEEAFLAAFAPDGIVDDWGRTFTGTTAIKEWSDKEFIGAHGTITTLETEISGDTVTITGDWRSTHANGRSRFTFTLADQKVALMAIREG